MLLVRIIKSSENEGWEEFCQLCIYIVLVLVDLIYR